MSWELWLLLGALLAYLLGALSAVRAVLTARTAQGAIAWAVSLVAFPWVALPLYWVFGRPRFVGYRRAHLARLAASDPVARRALAELAASGLVAGPEGRAAFLVERLARLPLTRGNDVELLVDGEEGFASIFAGIERASRYVLAEFYILRHDELGHEFKRLLLAKAAEGVAVHLLYDEIGSLGIGAAYLHELASGGVALHAFGMPRRRAHRFQLNFRNHRKIVVVDGREAWLGGLNIGDEYLGADPALGHWRDTQVRLVGPSVLGAQLAFAEDWLWACGEVLDLDWPVEAAETASRLALCLPSGPADPLETCTLFFLAAIQAARERLWIATPYFVPDEQFLSALELAALRGVDVRLLLPEKTDNRLAQLSSYSYLEQLERVGIRIYRYQDGFLHQKVVLIDDAIATVSTANFDNRSFRLNFEITALVIDEEFAAEVEAMLVEDLRCSRETSAEELRARSWLFRLAVRAARLLAPVQ